MWRTSFGFCAVMSPSWEHGPLWAAPSWCERNGSAPKAFPRVTCRAGCIWSSSPKPLAEATRELMAHVERGGPGPIRSKRGRRWRKPQINALRGAVFAVALACLVFAASVPRT